MFKQLNPIIHSPLRLSIMALLANMESADFNYIKEVTDATNGNISIQIQKLKEAEYITVAKTFKNNYSNTTYTITAKGREAFHEYIVSMKTYFDNEKLKNENE
jgi:DNA-binding MarR family transcriptional regulator